jgi:hypothetical protein
MVHQRTAESGVPAQRLLLSARGDAVKMQAVFDSLPGVEARTLNGFWRGEELPSGHLLDGLLAALGWAGKRFHADGSVDPLVFERGRHVFSVHPWLPARMVRLVLRWPRSMKSAPVLATARLALPALRTRQPRARLDRIDAHGAATAAIAYLDAPIIDELRGVDDGLVAGRMAMPGMAQPSFFLLHRVTDEETRTGSSARDPRGR